jgi:hypothetical protein
MKRVPISVGLLVVGKIVAQAVAGNHC